jgi:hypothetical protein
MWIGARLEEPEPHVLILYRFTFVKTLFVYSQELASSSPPTEKDPEY